MQWIVMVDDGYGHVEILGRCNTAGEAIDLKRTIHGPYQTAYIVNPKDLYTVRSEV